MFHRDYEKKITMRIIFRPDEKYFCYIKKKVFNMMKDIFSNTMYTFYENHSSTL